MHRTKVVIEASDGTQFVIDRAFGAPEWRLVRLRWDDPRLPKKLFLEPGTWELRFTSLAAAVSFVDTFFKGSGRIAIRHFWATDRKKVPAPRPPATA